MKGRLRCTAHICVYDNGRVGVALLVTLPLAAPVLMSISGLDA